MNKIGFKTKLSNLADVFQGQSPESIYYSNFEGVPFLQGNRTFGNLYPTFDTYTKKITKIAKKGEVLMSVRAPVGDLNFAPCDLCIGRGVASFRAKNGNNKFLYYALKYNIKNLIKQGGATTFDSVNKDIINDFELIIPESELNRDEISLFLYTLDSKIELNNRINSELELMAKTLYNYWFIQFDFPDKNGKPYKTSGGKMIYSEELKREIPEGWRVKKIGEFCDIYQPQTISDKDCIENGEYFVHGSNGIIGKYDKYNHEGSEIIVSCRGDCGNIHRTLPKVWITGNAMVFKMKDETIHNEFLYQALHYLGIKNISSGSVQGQITRTNVYSLKIVIPEKNIIDKFSEISKNIVTKKLLIQEENQKLVELRDWLLPMLMNGQVKVV